MTVFSQIVPGKVLNRGVNDRSIPDYDVSPATYPLHLPILQVITPKGPLGQGTHWIPTSDFISIYGDITDHKSPFYSPMALLLSQLSKGGQASIGVRRLSANDKVSRIPVSLFVQQKLVEDYKRDPHGQFELNADGERTVIGKFEKGLSVTLRPDYELLENEVGSSKMRTIKGAKEGDPDTLVYPLFEMLAGVGEEYNQNGAVIGSRTSVLDWRTVGEFVKRTGVFPFFMRQFIDTKSTGTRRFVKTKGNQDTVQFTLFKTEDNGVDYSIQDAINQYTGGNLNRPVTLRPAPFGQVFVYDDNITEVAQMMYMVEKPNNINLIDKGAYSFQQMNPFGCVDHNGQPYYAIETDDTTRWDMMSAMKARGGISPFYDNDGKLHSSARKTEMKDPLGLLANVVLPITVQQGWDILNALTEVDMKEYLDSDEIQNVTVNRHSMFWDIGYKQPVKDAMIPIIGRKDIFLQGDATIWEPGIPTPLQQVYSRLATMNNQLRNVGESEYWGTATMRSSINLFEAKVIDEATGWYFSGNLDLAFVYARFAGAANGLLSSANSPDHGVNRQLQTMHSPTIRFENDENSARNFDLGGVTIRPYDVEQLFRPALPTVYGNADSVLKDQVTAFLCVCIEKIAQDEWNVVCGDTSLSAESYSALVKDGIERKCRDRLGGLVRQVIVDATYNEASPGGRAIMNTVVHAYFNKGKYMMTLDLFAYNEADMPTNA